MKHVWILNHYAQEPGAAGGTRHFALAHHLPALGWLATILAASVELNTGRQRLADDELRRLDVIDEVPFLWIKTPTYDGNGAGRLRNMLSYARRAIMPGITRGLPRPDVIVGSSVHPFAALSAAILARRFRVPFVFEVRDLWPQTLVDLGRLKEGAMLTRLFRALEKWLYRRAARIIVLLPQADSYIVPLGIDPGKIVWIPNGVELGDSTEPDAPIARDVFTFMYFGAHGHANGLENVLHAMKHLQSTPAGAPVRLRLIGDGPRKPALMALAADLGLHNVSFEAPVARQQIPALAAEADAFVFNLVDAPVFRYGISSNKLFDFLAAARPIVFCCESSNNPVEDAGAGITVSPGNPEALADAMRHLVALPASERITLGAAGRAYVRQHHDFRSLAHDFARTLDDAGRA